jgi:hypothetical protein
VVDEDEIQIQGDHSDELPELITQKFEVGSKNSMCCPSPPDRPCSPFIINVCVDPRVKYQGQVLSYVPIYDDDDCYDIEYNTHSPISSRGFQFVKN